MSHAQNEKQVFFTEITKKIISFQKLFILSKYHLAMNKYWAMNFFLSWLMFFIKKVLFLAKNAAPNLPISLTNDSVKHIWAKSN